VGGDKSDRSATTCLTRSTPQSRGEEIQRRVSHNGAIQPASKRAMAASSSKGMTLLCRTHVSLIPLWLCPDEGPCAGHAIKGVPARSKTDSVIKSGIEGRMGTAEDEF
jgi:hypothetical protein